jgi:iron complex transport system substrate-binding protein
VAGRNTFVDDLIELCGATNAVPVSGWPEYSLEALAAHPPELMVLATPQSADQLQRFFRATVPWNELGAVQSGFWYVVDEDRFARPGPRIFAAAEDLNRILDQWEQRQ